MKIRKKITLWISGAALLSAIVFSSIIFRELTEDPFQLIDREIQHMATTLAERIRDAGSSVERLNLNGMCRLARQSTISMKFRFDPLITKQALRDCFCSQPSFDQQQE